jgi:hypothetical protein
MSRPFLTLGERPGTHCIGELVGFKVGYKYIKFSSYRDSIPGPTTLSRVAVPINTCRTLDTSPFTARSGDLILNIFIYFSLIP